MLFYMLITVAVDWFFELLSLIPLPAFSGVATLEPYVQQAVSFIPRAVEFIFLFLGPDCKAIVNFMVSVYMLGLDIFMAFWTVTLLTQVVALRQYNFYEVKLSNTHHVYDPCIEFQTLTRLSEQPVKWKGA